MASFTESDITTLEQAIVARKWATSITFSDRTIVFGSLTEARDFLAWMRAQVAAAAGRSNIRYAAHRKGV